MEDSPQITLFNWLIRKDKILTWENLQKRGKHGPGRCIMCKEALERVNHIFFECRVAIGLWDMLSHWDDNQPWRLLSLIQGFDFWATKGDGKKALPYYVCWEIWCNRNNLLFNEGRLDIFRMYTRILDWLHISPASDKVCWDLSIRIRAHCIQLPTVFFDGAQQEGVCGCGAWIQMEGGERYHIIWNGGPGTNNKAEIMALWSGLLVAHILMIPSIDIYGDSQIVIEGISGRASLRCTNLSGWVERIHRHLSLFQKAPLHHIYREHNGRADRPSKLGLVQAFGFIRVTRFSENKERDSFRISL